MIGRPIFSNLNKLHLSNSLDGLAWSMVGIFIPIYFLESGYSLTEVFLYYIIQNICILISVFLILHYSRYASLKKMILLRYPLLLFLLYGLYNLENLGSFIFYLAIIDGIQAMLFHYPFHVIFSNFANHKEMGSSTSKLYAIPGLAAIAGPSLGAFIALAMGFKVLFAFASLIFLLAFVPILTIRIERIRFDYSWNDGFQLFKKYKQIFCSEIFNNIGEEIEGIIWPIFVYISVSSIASVGYLGTILALSSAVFTLIVGKISDKKDKSKMIKFGAILIFMVWLMRYFAHTEYVFYMLTAISGMVFVIFSIPYYSSIYSLSQNEKTASFFAFREVPIAIARVLVFIIAIVFSTNIEYLFVIAALSYLFFIFWKNNIFSSIESLRIDGYYDNLE